MVVFIHIKHVSSFLFVHFCSLFFLFTRICEISSGAMIKPSTTGRGQPWYNNTTRSFIGPWGMASALGGGVICLKRLRWYLVPAPLLGYSGEVVGSGWNDHNLDSRSSWQTSRKIEEGSSPVSSRIPSYHFRPCRFIDYSSMRTSSLCLSKCLSWDLPLC